VPHYDARELISARLQEGDVVVAGSGYQAEAFAYHCEGIFDVLVTPHVDGEASTRGKVYVEQAEVERQTAEVRRRVEECLRAGGRAWYYFPASRWEYPIAEDRRIAPRHLSDRHTRLRAIHAPILEALEQGGERTLLQRYEWGYRVGYRLALYRSRSAAAPQ